MRSIAIAAVLLVLPSCCGVPCHQQHRRSSAALWEFREERASAEWCALHRTGPRFAAVLTPSDADQDRDTFDALFEGPVRISIQDGGVERYAWNGFDYSVWAIDGSLLVCPRFSGGVPGGSVVAVDLQTGAVVWETSLSYPAPQQGWSFWLNRKTIDVRRGRVLVWSMDGGRFLEVLDRRTGQSLGWHEFTGCRGADASLRLESDTGAVQLVAPLSAASFVGGLDFPSPPLPSWLVEYLRHLVSAPGDPLSLLTFRDPNAPLVGTVEVWGRRVNASSFEFRYVPYQPGKGTGAIATRIDLGPGGRLAWTPLRGGVSTFGLPAGASPVPGWAKVAPEQISAAQKHGVPVAFENDIGMRFVLVPAGTFLMGSPAAEQGRDELESQHRVTLTRPYYVQTTEVTNRQFRTFRQLHDSHDQWGRSLNGDEQPAVGVSWNAAAAFAVWLSRRDPGRGYRLPTEAEWERACRAGTTTAFWWGDTPSKEMANFYDGEFVSGRPSDPGFRVTVPVGTLPANPWGLYEVHGNAREWCSDWYDDSPYEEGAATDPQGPAPSGSRCTRGGAFGEAPYMLRAAWRIGVQGDDEARSYIGFRLVSPLPRE